jgi:REP element-mobilizing transposase RayT
MSISEKCESFQWRESFCDAAGQRRACAVPAVRHHAGTRCALCPPYDSRYFCVMPRYRRAIIPGGTFFFTVAIANRSDDLLIRAVDRLRRIYRSVQERQPFETIAICILPDHLHAIWALPENDTDFSLRWSLIKKRLFTRVERYGRALCTSYRQARERDLAAPLLGACDPR